MFPEPDIGEPVITLGAPLGVVELGPAAAAGALLLSVDVLLPHAEIITSNGKIDKTFVRSQIEKSMFPFSIAL
jgi:hypothetical protein